MQYQNSLELSFTDHHKSIQAEIESDLYQKFGSNTSLQWQSAFGDLTLVVEKDLISKLLLHLKSTGRFNMLLDLTAVDYPDREKRFDLVYILFSTKDLCRLRVKTFVDEGESVTSIVSSWKVANWFEREAYDMFGIQFKGHPDLSRLLTHHQFVGHPLRKDYRADHQQHCTESLPIHFEGEPQYKPDPDKELIPLNIGPSHPATHGTLRIMAELNGEVINRAHLEIGYLHRCFEKMAETHPYNQVIPYTDRLNYCSSAMNNVGYCKTVEKLLQVEIPERAQALRMIVCELSRLIDHVVCTSAAAFDLGALTGFFHLYTYREKVYSLFEKLCGARLTVSMTRVGGMAQDAPEGWFEEVLQFCKEMKVGIDEIDRLLSGNKIWIQRTRDVGNLSIEDALTWGYTGPCLRASGLPMDLRKTQPYYLYGDLDFDIPVGSSGDVYERYLVRLEEMRQSVRILEQLCKNMPTDDYTLRDKDLVLPEKKEVYGNIEGLMNHFMLVINGVRPPEGEVYDASEAANGELGFFLVSDGTGQPYRLKVRPPCFSIYQSFPEQVTGNQVADVISLLGSLNIIAGELDR